MDRLVREDLLVSDDIVLAGRPPEMSLRTVRRRFLFATRLTCKAIEQIERAKQAVDLLEQGVSLLEAAYLVGYADQSHMTRALKHLIGSTPAHIARVGSERTLKQLSILFKTRSFWKKYTSSGDDCSHQRGRNVHERAWPMRWNPQHSRSGRCTFVKIILRDNSRKNDHQKQGRL